MKLELLVIADQNAAVNAFPGLVHTARHTMGVGGARSRLANLLEAVVEGETNNWGEVPPIKERGGSRNKLAVSEGAAGSPPF